MRQMAVCLEREVNMRTQTSFIVLAALLSACGSDIKKDVPAPVVINTADAVAEDPVERTTFGDAIPLRIELTWDTTSTDLDLHFAHEVAGMDVRQPDLDSDGTPDPWRHELYDCNWRNKSPDWGASGSAHDPVSDEDVMDGYGPENVLIYNPQADVGYRVGVSYFADNQSVGPTVATVRVYADEELLGTYEQTLEQGDMWEAARVSGDGVLEFVGVLANDYNNDTLF